MMLFETLEQAEEYRELACSRYAAPIISDIEIAVPVVVFLISRTVL
jgi:hypothetical protein